MRGMQGRFRLLPNLLIAGVVACSGSLLMVDTLRAQPVPAPVSVRAYNYLTPAEKAAGFELLFDGASTDAWRAYRQETFPAQGWVIDDEALLVQTAGGGGDIVTKKQYTDFELILDFKVSAKANSGIMYRVQESQGAPWMTGAEFQVLDDAGYGVDALDSTSVGGCYALYQPSAEKVAKPVGEYNTARIMILDNHVVYFLNGVRLLEYDLDGEEFAARIAQSKFAAYDGFGIQASGHIALQDHGHDVWYRNIRIRDLSTPMPGEVTLFNGTDTGGWTWFSHQASEVAEVWRAEGGILKCNGKPAGYIRTTKKYDNFVLKLQWRWDPTGDAKRRNSGVLVRMIGEDKVWPKSVEAQLQSGSAGDFWNIENFAMDVDGERTRGRNTKKLKMAEYAVGEWNEYEIVVDHSEINVYINGDLVNHAWNVEEVAGYICLQSEGAAIEFRNIRLAPID